MRYEYAYKKDYQYITANDKHLLAKLIVPKIKAQQIIIARDETEKNIGWLRYGYFWDNIPFMNMLYVNEKQRGKGIGRGLVEFWEAEMKSEGHSRVMTSSLADEHAQHFYRKLGYKDAGCLLLENNALEIIFTKKIQV